ncbi:hypothetical protein [Bremerella sp.]|uniref:hypothetical protein n=1 Tax=Bremerella sp. TaxID=2795602 RepID=UPI003919C0F1
MRFSLRNLLICVTLLFLLLPAMRPVADYIRREREKAILFAEIERLKLKLEKERAARIYYANRTWGRSKLQEAELRRLDEENERLVKSETEMRRLLEIENHAAESENP